MMTPLKAAYLYGSNYLIDFRSLEIELLLLYFVFAYLPLPSQMSKKRSVLHFEKSG